MRTADKNELSLSQPQLLEQAKTIAHYISNLSLSELSTSMHISNKMAIKTLNMMSSWNTTASLQSPAIDTFLGDMYSGLQASELSTEDRDYANTHLRILSGLYGVLRPLDGIQPYRLEIGYTFPDKPFNNLYKFWGESISCVLPEDELVFNLSSAEYTKAVFPYLQGRTIITPKFITLDSAGVPKQVVVHSKIARGAYVRWLIQNRINSANEATEFDLLGYAYNKQASNPTEPYFACQTFQGLGLSVRQKST